MRKTKNSFGILVRAANVISQSRVVTVHGTSSHLASPFSCRYNARQHVYPALLALVDKIDSINTNY